MLDQEFKTRWLEALRSGKYKQTRGRLRSRNGAMCCLGVACDLLGVEWEWDPTVEGHFTGKNGAYRPAGEETDAFYPSEEVREQIGLSYREAMDLGSMNDGLGYDDNDDPIKKCSFAQIADHIEANL